MKLKIYTIGHSTRIIDEFIEILRAYGIEKVIDIRTIPKSRHNPQFNQEKLRTALHNRHIAYHHMKDLGGLRHARKDSINTAWENASFRGFADYMQTPKFNSALDKLIEIAKEKQIVIMCAEAVPWHCHRSLIGDALLIRDIDVIDIFSATNSKAHELTPWAFVSNGKVTYPKD